MKHVAAIAVALLAALTFVSARKASAPAPKQVDRAAAQSALDRAVDRFFDECYFRYHPTAGTAAGFHQYDARLEDVSRTSVAAEVACLKSHLADFEALPAKGLGPDAAADRELAITSIRGSVLDLETIRMWEKDPDRYSSGLSNSVFLIMARNYAPQAERLRSVVARERLMPQALQVARANLK